MQASKTETEFGPEKRNIVLMAVVCAVLGSCFVGFAMTFALAGAGGETVEWVTMGCFGPLGAMLLGAAVLHFRRRTNYSIRLRKYGVFLNTPSGKRRRIPYDQIGRVSQTDDGVSIILKSLATVALESADFKDERHRKLFADLLSQHIDRAARAF